MSKFKPKPEVAQWLTPYLMVKDMAKTLDFYQNALGFKIGMQMPGPGGAIMHAEIEHKGKVIIMCAPEGAHGTTNKCPASGGFEAPSSMYIYVDDVDAAFERAKVAGASVVSPPEDMFWGDRICRLTDPSGYPLMLGTHIGEENAPPPPKMD